MNRARFFASCLAATFVVVVTACGSPHLRPRAVSTDVELEGVWQVERATTAGKPLALPGFVLTISGNRYEVGAPQPNDRGSLVLFGDELAGEPRRMDVLGESGPNKGKRYPAIYRMQGRSMDICYDLSEKERPTEFVSRDGSRTLCITYLKKG